MERTHLVASLLHVGLALALAPLLPGIIRRVKATAAGRRGPPLLQMYFDLAKLLRKGAVYSRTTSLVFVAGPIVSLAAVAATLLLTPLGGVRAAVPFAGDLILAAYLLGLGRLATVLAAWDVGSSFEGMGASREAVYSALAEPALLLALAALAGLSHSLSLTTIYASIDLTAAAHAGPVLLLVAAALAAVFVTENARIPIDDPTTHLELTMIHEVLVLDHGGPDLAMIEYAAALKLWITAAWIVGVAAPLRSGRPLVDLVVGLAGLAAVAVLTGVVESSTARLKLVRVPQFLVAAAVLSILALVLVLR